MFKDGCLSYILHVCSHGGWTLKRCRPRPAPQLNKPNQFPSDTRRTVGDQHLTWYTWKIQDGAPLRVYEIINLEKLLMYWITILTVLLKLLVQIDKIRLTRLILDLAGDREQQRIQKETEKHWEHWSLEVRLALEIRATEDLAWGSYCSCCG